MQVGVFSLLRTVTTPRKCRVRAGSFGHFLPAFLLTNQYLYNMNQKLNNIACKVIGYAGYIFLTLFAVIFAVTCCGVFIIGVSESDFFALIISAICAFCAWACWTIRKDTLI